MMTYLLAQMGAETVQQIKDIHDRIGTQPAWSFRLVWVLMILVAVVVALIFVRQKKLAQNQVELARLVDTLAGRK